MRVIKLTWLDANFSSKVISKYQAPEPVILESVGWVVKDSRQSLSIAQEYCKKDDTYRHTLTVPREYIIKIKSVNIKE